MTRSATHCIPGLHSSICSMETRYPLPHSMNHTCGMCTTVYTSNGSPFTLSLPAESLPSSISLVLHLHPRINLPLRIHSCTLDCASEGVCMRFSYLAFAASKSCRSYFASSSPFMLLRAAVLSCCTTCFLPNKIAPNLLLMFATGRFCTALSWGVHVLMSRLYFPVFLLRVYSRRVMSDSMHHILFQTRTTQTSHTWVPLAIASGNLELPLPLSR